MADDTAEEMRNLKLLVQKILAILKLVNNDEILQTRNSILLNETKGKVYDLCDGKHTVGDIVTALGTTQPTISYHLSSLLEAGLVLYEDIRGNRYYFKTLE